MGLGSALVGMNQAAQAAFKSARKVKEAQMADELYNKKRQLIDSQIERQNAMAQKALASANDIASGGSGRADSKGGPSGGVAGSFGVLFPQGTSVEGRTAVPEFNEASVAAAGGIQNFTRIQNAALARRKEEDRVAADLRELEQMKKDRPVEELEKKVGLQRDMLAIEKSRMDIDSKKRIEAQARAKNAKNIGRVMSDALVTYMRTGNRAAFDNAVDQADKMNLELAKSGDTITIPRSVTRHEDGSISGMFRESDDVISFNDPEALFSFFGDTDRANSVRLQKQAQSLKALDTSGKTADRITREEFKLAGLESQIQQLEADISKAITENSGTGLWEIDGLEAKDPESLPEVKKLRAKQKGIQKQMDITTERINTLNQALSKKALKDTVPLSESVIPTKNKQGAKLWNNMSTEVKSVVQASLEVLEVLDDRNKFLKTFNGETRVATKDMNNLLGLAHRRRSVIQNHFINQDPKAAIVELLMQLRFKENDIYNAMDKIGR